MNIEEDILNGARTAFIDESYKSSPDFKPKLLFNSKDSKVRNEIIDRLRTCDEFIISTAFINLSGITPLLEELKILEKKNVKGKILTTDYLSFTEPKALKKLNKFKNIEIRMFTTENEGFHTKGYIFKRDDSYLAIVGSSNLTASALTKNKEWNVEFSTNGDGEIIINLLNEFNELWSKSHDLDEILPTYEKLYNDNKNFKELRQTTEELRKSNIVDLAPNSMQEEFLKNVRNLIKQGEKRAILVSATGTGKTYASAFAVRDFNPKRFLFIVHREQIAKQSINAYKNVIKNKSFGMLTGNNKDFKSDYIFATIQTLSKGDVYTRFKSDEFDYIVIDEVHKAGALSYQKIFSYFTPKFYLGMTASPERTDGFDIYELFNHNIAHEIRLQEALEEDLLCPFHYFGIKDVTFDNEVIDDNFTDFNCLASDKRVDYLLEKSEFYGYSGERIKALVFCSRKKEAKMLATEFNRRGHPSEVLTGEDSQAYREETIDRLTNDANPRNLEYIFTVDIFNEGVDIPEINQVILARPTQSPIIFIQQLGRGLRKFKSKEFVVILDFIGNYKNNFMIPLALSGDRSYDKDNLRRYLMEGNKIIPGASSINFDEISKRRIFESINNTSFSKIALFKEKYNNLKFKLGKIPSLYDFAVNAEFNPELILSHKKFDSYHSFLSYVDDDYTGELDSAQIASLKLISKKLLKGIRPHEMIILNCLRYNKYFNMEMIEKCLNEIYGLDNQNDSINGAINFLSLNFYRKENGDGYQANTVQGFVGDAIPYENIFFNDDFTISDYFWNCLANPTYLRHFEDAVNYALFKYENYYRDEKPFKLYEKYSREDVLRLLNWKHFMNGQNIGGYKIKYNTCPIFVTYNKAEDISETINYDDQFISKECFSWMSRDNRKTSSAELEALINYNDLDVELFIQKNNDEGIEFYYIGKLTPLTYKQLYRNIGGKDKPIVNFTFKIDNPVKDELYDYFTKD
ncbi:DEAD/DEAH box helicase [Methanobrevibacter millerae]|uniref:Helicase conserved C-terminal domain-containing protein n=1 Tax=Methanobrevibacter millerae TaxID=230361 RepID=A0A1G5X3K8_9EURY|nr:DEAD/DEAH box helicase [Methanobrevibacter millerae]SDA65018.1 Helicase conserved C-terminal domain-containing protein [Methanobrevibacter millerae]